MPGPSPLRKEIKPEDVTPPAKAAPTAAPKRSEGLSESAWLANRAPDTVKKPGVPKGGAPAAGGSVDSQASGSQHARGQSLPAPLSATPPRPSDLPPQWHDAPRTAPASLRNTAPAPPRTGPAPDLDTAFHAMKQADQDLGTARANLEKGQRQLRTSSYALEAYKRNPPHAIDPNRLASMENDAEWKKKVVGALENRVAQASRLAEACRRDVRAALTSDR